MDNYNSLDLDQIKAIISNYLSIAEAKDYLFNEEVSFNPLIIKRNLSLTKEATQLLNKGLIVGFDGIINVNELLEKANKDIVLTGNELYRILTFHNHCNRIKNIFSKEDKELLLNDYLDSIYVENSLFNHINEIIDNNGELRNDASPLLKEINNKISSLEKEIINKATSFISKHASSLQEPVYYIRNNRINFLIKNSDKNKYAGYTYGTSSSGLATYVEPGIFVELDNQKISLEEDKLDEEYRILSEITYRLSEFSNQYISNFQTLIELSIIFAKAYYGLDNKAIISEINEDHNLSLEGVAHPLINKKDVVRNNYHLDHNYQGIVISGSNTGGKTVGLKTIGLSIIMSYLGIPVDADVSNIPLFDNIFVDIDDNQSITSSLSTFSAHITNINNILNNATNNSLILIDELISGTDPKEAQAISLAIIDKIKEIGAKFVITTHFDDIKQYSYEDDSILLSSVGFDLKTLKPTYKYYENSIGASNALEIASRYFSDASIIDNAKNYLDKKASSSDELIKDLALKIEENNNLRNELENNINEANKLKEEYNNQIKSFDKEKEILRNKYIEELNVYLEDIKKKAEDKLDSIKDKKEDNILNDIEDLKIEEELIEKHEFEVGDNVRIMGNNQLGFISEINDDNVTVNIKNISVKTKLDKLEFVGKRIKEKVYEPKTFKRSAARELNVIGLRADEAIEKVDIFIDDAYGSNYNNVKIIHGIGTGALRKAIREHLNKMRIIKATRNGDFHDGGSAVTIVEFK